MSRVDPRWWVAILAFAFAANFFVANIYFPLAGVPAVGIEFRFSETLPRVRTVEPNSPAANAGVLPGDLITHVAGHRIESINDYYLEEQLIQRTAPLRMTVERVGAPVDLSISSTASYFSSLNQPDRIALIFWMLVAALELVLALSLAYSRPKDSAALLAAVFIAVLTTLNGQSAGLVTAFRLLPLLLKVIIFPVLLISIGIPFFAFAFCANFPRPIVRSRLKWTLMCLPALGIYLFTAILNVFLLFGPHPERLFVSKIGSAYQDLQLLLVVIMAAYSIAAVIAIVINFRRCDTVERRRVKLMLVGALLGLQVSFRPQSSMKSLTPIRPPVPHFCPSVSACFGSPSSCASSMPF